MRIVFFSHPEFSVSPSMPRYAHWLMSGMKNRGHDVELWKPEARFFKLLKTGSLRKWMGYIDQYIVFPLQIRSKIRKMSAEPTLFVFTDHALGPWVPLITDKPHLIHCHDFLAQQSALGQIPENKTSWTGKSYQSFIRRGYRQGANFISVSRKTQNDLHTFLEKKPAFSEVVYNAINPMYQPGNIAEARANLGNPLSLDLSAGYLLHVGGNQWYKNRKGVLELYDAWRTVSSGHIPLLLIGEKPSPELLQLAEESAFKKDIHFLPGLSDQQVVEAYRGASIFLFPSLAEGFGWPIVEAMACGCRVITTNEAPMTEVAGKAAGLIDRKPPGASARWASEGAALIESILNESEAQRQACIEAGFENARKYNAEVTTDRIERIYKTVLVNHSSLSA